MQNPTKPECWTPKLDVADNEIEFEVSKALNNLSDAIKLLLDVETFGATLHIAPRVAWIHIPTTGSLIYSRESSQSARLADIVKQLAKRRATVELELPAPAADPESIPEGENASGWPITGLRTERGGGKSEPA